MLNKLNGGAFSVGDGRLSGYIAVALLAFLGVLAFHFPQYLTTPQLRQYSGGVVTLYYCDSTVSSLASRIR